MTPIMLKLNDTKTEVMVIKPSRNQIAIEVQKVRIADADIKPSKKAKKTYALTKHVWLCLRNTAIQHYM